MKRHSKLKGTVLFTVISVMSLLIIFLTSTLVLATSASNRSHKNYAATQTEYTARAAIDSFTQAMRDDNSPGVAQKLVNMKSGDILTPYVDINDSSMGQIGYYDNSGKWQSGQILVECVDDTYSYNNTEKKWEAQQVIKITATAELAGEETTSTLYIRKKSPDEEEPVDIKGLQTASAMNMDATTGYYSGALGIGLKDNFDISKHYKTDANTIIDTDITFVNASFDVNGDGAYIRVSKPNTGTVIMGDLYSENGKLVNIEYNMTEDYIQKEVPYLYVDGKISHSSNDLFIGDLPIIGANPSTHNPYNIFAGSVNITQGTVYADMYLMDSDGDNIFGSESTTLNSWISSVVQKAETQYNSYGGSIYSKGKLTLKNAVLNGNVRCENDVIIDADGNGDVVINGDLVLGAGKTLTFNGKNKNKSLKVSGNVYCDNVNLNGLPNDHFTIKGVQYGDSVLGDDYIEVDNVYHQEEITLKAGYLSSTNARRFEKFEATEQVPEWEYHYKGLYGEDIGYSQTVYYDYDYKTDTIFPSWHVPWDGIVTSGLYVETDPYGNETGYIVNDEQSYFKDGNRVSKEEACNITPEYYTVKAMDNITDTGVVTTDLKSYYKNTGEKVDASVAYASPVLPSSSFDVAKNGGGIYPKTMTREAITGKSDNGQYKIIKTLEDMRKQIGYNGGFDTTNVYYTKVPGGTDDFDKITVNGNVITLEEKGKASVDISEINITKNTILNVKNANDTGITVKITPGKNTLWVVLDNCQFESGEDKIIVDDSEGGTVNFFVQTKLSGNALVMETSQIKENAKIVTTYPTDDPELDKLNTKININWYGSENSEINLQNNITIIGTAKMPASTFTAPVGEGKYSVNYNGEILKPSWIGSGLFETVQSNNNFQLLHVDNANGGKGSTISNLALDQSWRVMYYDAY